MPERYQPKKAPLKLTPAIGWDDAGAPRIVVFSEAQAVEVLKKGEPGTKIVCIGLPIATEASSVEVAQAFYKDLADAS